MRTDEQLRDKLEDAVFYAMEMDKDPDWVRAEVEAAIQAFRDE